MFTGIIEELGKIEKINQSGEAIVMSIAAKQVLTDVQLGDSISVNGVCLTVTSFTNQSFTVDLMPETVRHTSLRELQRGSRVNLERAMAANGRFGGHFVSGHVDGVGKIIDKKTLDNAVYYEVSVPEELSQYFIVKGSVTVDGTSLTVFGVGENRFTVSIIPHTLSETVIGQKGKGDIVNIECDILGKYIEQMLEQRFGKATEPKSAAVTMDFLKENGFQ